MIDGARIASPGLLMGALEAARLHPRPVVSSLGFHLGPKVQMVSTKEGYDQLREDQLLERVAWEEDGYRLFDISVLAGSSSGGWFQPIAESNALFMPRELWQALGGFDESFRSAGGGLVNLDAYARACKLADTQLITLLGEGTFHQVHGGISTNAQSDLWHEFHAEYLRIRHEPFAVPRKESIYVGRLSSHALRFVEYSARLLLEEQALQQSTSA
jgi:hypothetical protein